MRRVTWQWRQKTKSYPHVYLTTTSKYQISQFRSMASRFRVTGHLATSAQNEPKIALNTKVICTLSSRFLSLASCLQGTVHFDTSVLNDPKMALNTKGAKTLPYKYDNYPWLLNFTFSLYGQPSSSYRPFWHKCTNWPQNDIDTKRSKLPHIHKRTTPESNHSISLLGTVVFKCRPFWDKCTEWPQSDSKH